MFKTTLKIFSNLLYTIVVIGVLAIALLFVGTKVDVFGYEVKIVKSGSMEPAIATGGIVIIKPTATYEVGDVITYSLGARGSVPVTHRVIEKNGQGRSATYVTMGDANEDVDPNLVRHRDVIGAVAFTLPYLGTMIEFARTPLGFVLLIGVPALLIILDEVATIIYEVRKHLHLRRHGKVGYRVPSRERQVREQKRPIERKSAIPVRRHVEDHEIRRLSVTSQSL